MLTVKKIQAMAGVDGKAPSGLVLVLKHTETK